MSTKSNLSMISRWAGVLGLVCLASIRLAGLPADAPAAGSLQEEEGKGRPEAVLRVNPAMIFPPARLVATVELKEGADDYQDYYCPAIEWLWGDGAQSETGEDCDPYVAGKTTIRRRYSASHSYKSIPLVGATGYEVVFRMKQGSKVVLTRKQNVRVR